MTLTIALVEITKAREHPFREGSGQVTLRDARAAR